MSDVIEQAAADIRRDEGFVPHVYQDSLGIYTIGYGRQVDRHHGGGITEAEAELLLYNDIRNVMGEMDQRMAWWRDLPDGPARALLNMAFNLGLPRLEKFVKMLQALEVGDWSAAAVEATDSIWFTQVGERAERIVALFREGDGE